MSEQKTKTVSVRLPLDMYRKAKAIALYRDLTLNDLGIELFARLIEETPADVNKLADMLGAGTPDAKAKSASE